MAMPDFLCQEILAISDFCFLPTLGCPLASHPLLKTSASSMNQRKPASPLDSLRELVGQHQRLSDLGHRLAHVHTLALDQREGVGFGQSLIRHQNPLRPLDDFA